jgi:FixJ family two-component response regulator
VKKSQKHGPRILVVDDELGMRQGCQRALTPRGFQVHTAEYAAQGLRKLREESFDLVLLDAMMPGMSGLEFLEHVREQNPDLICIMITGYATVDLVAQAMKQGAHDFLSKPFTSDELVAVVQRGLEERQRRLTLQQQKEQDEENRQWRRARQEAAKLDAIESRFMLVVVHELRNPAGALKNYLQLLRSGYVDDDEWDDYLKQMDLRASQLLDMLDDLLELAYLKEMVSPLRLKPVAVADVLEEVIRQVQPIAEANGLTLEVKIEARPAAESRSHCLNTVLKSLAK